MASSSPAPSQENETIASDLAGLPSFFIDPAGAARRVHTKRFWIWPLLIGLVTAVITAILIAPVMIHVAEIGTPPENVSPEQYQQGVKFISGITPIIAPVFVLIFLLLETLILLAASAILGANAKFVQLLNLTAGCSLIQTLGAIAATVVVKLKTDISVMSELRPPMGLDILLPEGANKFLAAILAGFSVFNIWWVVMLALIFSAAFKLSKGKGFAAAIPVWVLLVLFQLLGAAGQK